MLFYLVTTQRHSVSLEIEVNDATDKSHRIASSENSVQSWHRCLVFCHHLITLSALYSIDCGQSNDH